MEGPPLETDRIRRQAECDLDFPQCAGRLALVLIALIVAGWCVAILAALSFLSAGGGA